MRLPPPVQFLANHFFGILGLNVRKRIQGILELLKEIGRNIFKKMQFSLAMILAYYASKMRANEQERQRFLLIAGMS